MVSGLPRTVVVSSAEIRQAMEEPLHTTSSTPSARTLDQTPPELAGDIMDRGIVLTGGGALLRGLDDRLRHETGMPVHVADDPLTSVAMGAAKCVEEFAGLQQVFVAGPTATAALMGRPQPPGRAAAAPFLLVALLMACATLITLDYHGGTGSPMEPARRAMGEVFGPVESAAASAVRPLTAVPDWFRTRSSMRHEIATLAAQNSDLRHQVVTSDVDRNRLAEYDGLTSAASTLGQALVPARVVGIGATPDRSPAP